MPKTTPGKWSVWLAVSVILLVVISQVFVAIVQGGEEIPVDSPLVVIMGAAAGFCGISAFITGIISIVRTRERSIPVYLAVTLGFTILLFNIVGLIFES